MSPRLLGSFVGLLVVVAAVATYFLVGRDMGPRGPILDLGNPESSAASSDSRQQQGPLLPTFDIVRVDAEGTSVIAGRGEGGATIVVLANGKEAARDEIARGGEWAVYLDTPFSGRAVELTLDMIMADGSIRHSKQVVVVAVPERAGERPLVVLGSPDAPSRVLQNPQSDDDTLVLTLDVVDYDAEGALVLSGRADKGSALRIYANNKLIGETRASESGLWVVRPGDVLPPGQYQLRIDQLTDAGKVKLRIELPLERAEPGAVLAAMAQGGGRVVVQPGNSLWRIARRVYGSGFEYTVIYQANQDQIRDPDMIYPGQIFDLPARD